MVADSAYSPRGVGCAALGASLLGALLGGHVVWLVLRWAAAPIETQWCAYAALLAAFHLGEFLLIAACQPSLVSFDSFLLNHSTAYGVAAVAACAEFWLEATLVPSWKGRGPLATVGLAMVLGGQALRAAAMLTAGSSFTHLVATRRTRSHVLVVRGVYAHVRHPAYCGWLVWSVGTQVLLTNPVCALAYAAAAWSFFAARVPGEEDALLAFFGVDYARYARTTWSGIPLLPGCSAITDAEAAARQRVFQESTADDSSHSAAEEST